MHLIQISLKYGLSGLINNKSTPVEEMAGHWTDDKPFPAPAMAQLNDAYTSLGLQVIKANWSKAMVYNR